MMNLLKQFCLVLIVIGASFANASANEAPEKQAAIKEMAPTAESIEKMAFAVETYVRFGKTPDPITEAYNECENDKGATAEIAQCMSLAYESYNKLMNQVYQRVLEKSDADTAKTVTEAQQKWDAFRKAEDTAQGTFPRQGTVRTLLLGDKSIIGIRQRIAELSFYLQATAG